MATDTPRASAAKYLASHATVLTHVEIAASLILSNVVCKVIWHLLCFYLAVIFFVIELILTILLWLGCVRLGSDGRPALLTDIDSVLERVRDLVGWDALVDRVRNLTAAKVFGDEDVPVRLSFPANSSVANFQPNELIQKLTKGLSKTLSVSEKRLAVFNSSPSPQQQTSMFKSAIKNQLATAGIASGKLARMLGLGGKKAGITSSSGHGGEESGPVEADVILKGAKYVGEPTANELFEKLTEAFASGNLPPPLDEMTSLTIIESHQMPIAANLPQKVRKYEAEPRSPHSTKVESASKTSASTTTQLLSSQSCPIGDFESAFPTDASSNSAATKSNSGAQGVGLLSESTHDGDAYPESEQKGSGAELVKPKVSFATSVQFSDAESKQQDDVDAPTARLWFNFPHSEVDKANFNEDLGAELGKLLNVPSSRFKPLLLDAASPRDHVVADLSFLQLQAATGAGAVDPSSSNDDLLESLHARNFSRLNKKEFPLCSNIQQIGDQSMFDPPAGARVGFHFPYSDITRETFDDQLAVDLATLLNVPKERIHTETVPCSDPLASVYCDITFIGAKEGTDEPTALSLLQTLRAYNFEEAGLPTLLSGIRSIEPFGSETDLDQPESGVLRFKIGYDSIDHDFLPTVAGQLAEFLNEPSRRIVASFPANEKAEDDDLDSLKRIHGSSPVLLNVLIAGASGPHERRAVEIADTIECADFSSASKPLCDIESFDRLEFVDVPLLTRMGFGIGHGHIKDPHQFLAMLRGDLGALLDIDEKRVAASLPNIEEKLAQKAKREAKMAELEELVGTIGDAGGSNVKGMRAKADLVALREEAEIANKEELVAEVRFEAAQNRHERPTSVIMAELETTNFAYCGSSILSKLKTLESFGRDIEEEPLVARLNFEQTFAEIDPDTFEKEMVAQISATLKASEERFEFLLPQVGGDIKPNHKVHAAVKLLPPKNAKEPGVHELFEALRKRRAQDMPTITSVDYADPAAARKKYGTLGKKKWKRHDLSGNKKPPRNFTYADARGGVLPLFKVDKGARERLVSQGVYKRASMRRGKERVVGE